MSGAVVETDAARDERNAVAVRMVVEGASDLDRRMLAYSDLFSPIVVKEVRQSLRSRQFIWSMAALLTAILVWSFFVVLGNMPNIYYRPAGMQMLGGYFLMLVVPTFVLVPIAAYMSLSQELSSNTFEVLSISPMSAGRIVWGKIAVALLQLLLFVSVLAPCVFFSYLLQGVQLTTIIYPFVVTVTFSILLICFGVMLGSNARTTFQSLFGLFLLLGASIFLLIGFSTFTFEVFFDESPNDAAATVAAVVVIALSYAVLFALAAASQIGISGENYARPIRLWLAMQAYLIFVFIASAGVIGGATRESLSGAMPMALLHLTITGIIVVAQSGVISPRTQRTLPRRLVSRLLQVCLIPGGGIGYFFILTVAGSLTFSTLLLMSMPAILGNSTSTSTYLMTYTRPDFYVTVFAYLAFYLGLERIVMAVLPAGGYRRESAGVLIFLLLLSMGMGIPYFISIALHGISFVRYEFYTVFNVFWTLGDFGIVPSGSLQLLWVCAAAVLGVNLLMVSYDVVMVRQRNFADDLAATAAASTPDPFADSTPPVTLSS